MTNATAAPAEISDQTPSTGGGSAGAVDTALAALGYGYAAYLRLRHFVISTYCALNNSTVPSGISVLGLTHTGTAPGATYPRSQYAYPGSGCR
jgi:hypothetical protein